MKRVYLTYVFLLLVFTSFCQPTLIKNKVSQIFYGVTFPITRFDIREKFNSSLNLYDYEEYDISNTDYDVVDVKIKNNPILGYTQSSINKKIKVEFKKGYDRSNIISMSLWYKIENVSLSRNQLNELVKIFKPISYKIEKQDSFDDNNNKIGEDYFVYSTKSNFEKNKHCIFFNLEFRKEEHKIEKNVTYQLPNGDYYWIKFMYNNDYLK
jgi:hypothetical protein